MLRLPLALISTALVAGALCAAAGAAGPLGRVTVYTAGLQPDNGSSIRAIAQGPDGNLWFTDSGHKAAIGRVTADGQVTEFSTGLNPGSRPVGIAAGPDGDLWFTDRGTTRAIGRITPAGEITEFSAGLADPTKTMPGAITAGPDGNVWFATSAEDHVSIGRITPTGQITEYPVGFSEHFGDLVAGSDGNVWFADQSEIGRITPTGQIKKYEVDAAAEMTGDLAAGPDGALWFPYSAHFDDNATKVARITTDGQVSVVGVTGLQVLGESNLTDIAAGSDGNFWFADDGENDGTIDRMTPNGRVTLFTTPSLLPIPLPTTITAGPGGDMWFAARSPVSVIGRVGTGAGSAPRHPPVTVLTCAAPRRNNTRCRTRLTRSPPARSSTQATVTDFFQHVPTAVGTARTIGGNLVVTMTSLRSEFACIERLRLRTGHRVRHLVLHMGFNC